MQPTNEPTEPEQSYPPGYGRPVGWNALLLVAVIGLIGLAGLQHGPYGGLGYLLVVVALLGLGALVNLVLVFTAQSGRGIYLLAAVLFGAMFLFFFGALGHVGKIGG